MFTSKTECIKEFDTQTRRDFFLDMKDHWDSRDFSEKRKIREACREAKENVIALAKTDDAWNIFTEIIEDESPEIFQKMISNLDSGSYETLFDLYDEFNNIHKSEIVFPPEALKIIKIK